MQSRNPSVAQTFQQHAGFPRAVPSLEILEPRLFLDAAPALTVPEAFVVAEDVTATVVPAIVLTDAGDGAVEMTLSAGHGMLTLGDTTGLTFLAGGNGQASMTVQGLPDDLNAALGVLSYLGDQDYNGPDAIAVSAAGQTVGLPGAGTATLTDNLSFVSAGVELTTATTPPVWQTQTFPVGGTALDATAFAEAFVPTMMNGDAMASAVAPMDLALTSGPGGFATLSAASPAGGGASAFASTFFPGSEAIANAQAQVNVAFTLSGEFNYTLDVMTLAPEPAPGATPPMRTALLLPGAAGELTWGAGLTNTSYAGLLPAGDYTLVMTTTVAATADGVMPVVSAGEYDLQFALTPVDTGGGGDPVDWALDGVIDMTVTPVNDVPTVTDLAMAPGAIDEGQSVTLTGLFADPDVGDVHTVTIDWGDGEGDEITLVDDARDFEATHPYLDDDPAGAYTVTVTVSDAESISAPVGAAVAVENVAPVVTALTGPALAVPGLAVSFAAEFTDDGALDTHTVAWTVTDPAGVAVEITGGTLAFTPDQVGLYTVEATVTDDGGDSDTATAELTVQNIAVMPDPLGSGQRVLFVGGTDGKDKIEFKGDKDTGGIVLKITDKDRQDQDHYHGHHHGRHHHRYTTTTWNIAGPIDRIVAFGLGGDDDIKVHKSVGDIPAELYGGDGEDKLRGGKGDDILVGGLGDDTLAGDDGRDVMIGGLGRDKVVGDKDDDIIIGGVYLGQDDRAALNAVTAEWTRTDLEYADRVANLIAGTGLNGGVVINDTTVFDDGERDKLAGKQGLDWLLANADDDKTDLHHNEILTDVTVEFLTAEELDFITTDDCE